MKQNSKTYHLKENGSWTSGVGIETDPTFKNLVSGYFVEKCESECKKRATPYIIGASIAAFTVGVVLTLMIKK